MFIILISLDLACPKNMDVNKLISPNLEALATLENGHQNKYQLKRIQTSKYTKKENRDYKNIKKLIDQVQDLKENKNLLITQIAEIT